TRSAGSTARRVSGSRTRPCCPGRPGSIRKARSWRSCGATSSTSSLDPEGDRGLTPDYGTNSVLVTGSAGWLARRLVAVLTEGLAGDQRLSSAPPDLTVRGLDLVPAAPTQGARRVEELTGDLRDPATCNTFCAGARGSVLIHTAGVIHPRRVA